MVLPVGVNIGQHLGKGDFYEADITKKAMDYRSRLRIDFFNI